MTSIPTSLVGSYPQPDWLIDREALNHRLPPRVRARDLWRVPDEYLEQAWDDATIYAIAEQERAGLDIITDGEMRRESYSNRFATALTGIDHDRPGTVILIALSGLACSRRNCTSRTCTAWRRLIGPVTRGTGTGSPLRSSAVPWLSRSTPSSAVAKRLE